MWQDYQLGKCICTDFENTGYCNQSKHSERLVVLCYFIQLFYDSECAVSSISISTTGLQSALHQQRTPLYLLQNSINYSTTKNHSDKFRDPLCDNFRCINDILITKFHMLVR